MIRIAQATALMLFSLTSCAAVPVVPLASTASSYLMPLASDIAHERIVADPADEARDRELAELRNEVRVLQQEVKLLHGPRQLVQSQPSLTVEDLRRINTLQRDREANKAAFGR